MSRTAFHLNGLSGTPHRHRLDVHINAYIWTKKIRTFYAPCVGVATHLKQVTRRRSHGCVRIGGWGRRAEHGRDGAASSKARERGPGTFYDGEYVNRRAGFAFVGGQQSIAVGRAVAGIWRSHRTDVMKAERSQAQPPVVVCSRAPPPSAARTAGGGGLGVARRSGRRGRR
ncbi:hypothetical protein C8Q77DRAFT_224838 [Trametes polyzona]|nr:hypothetical protein C8Q77DRAFT_224838 [Trametes polyzona]